MVLGRTYFKYSVYVHCTCTVTVYRVRVCIVILQMMPKKYYNEKANMVFKRSGLDPLAPWGLWCVSQSGCNSCSTFFRVPKGHTSARALQPLITTASTVHALWKITNGPHLHIRCPMGVSAALVTWGFVCVYLLCVLCAYAWVCGCARTCGWLIRYEPHLNMVMWLKLSEWIPRQL